MASSTTGFNPLSCIMPYCALRYYFTPMPDDFIPQREVARAVVLFMG